MGGLGSGMAAIRRGGRTTGAGGRRASRKPPAANVLIEESIYGWKEFELELMRDGNDNVVVVCSKMREPRPDGRAHRRLGSPSRRP